MVINHHIPAPRLIKTTIKMPDQAAAAATALVAAADANSLISAQK